MEEHHLRSKSEFVLGIGCRTFLADCRFVPDAWPATKDELIDYAMRSGAPLEVIENLQEMEDEGEIYESIEDIWPGWACRSWRKYARP